MPFNPASAEAVFRNLQFAIIAAAAVTMTLVAVESTAAPLDAEYFDRRPPTAAAPDLADTNEFPAFTLREEPVPAAVHALPDSRSHWYCWLAPPATVSCLLESAPSSIDTGGVDFEALQRLPSVVSDMRTDPGRLRGERIDIPLHGSPVDLDFVAVLARSVMCGSQRHCAVSFTEQADAGRIAALLDTGAPTTGSPPRNLPVAARD